MHGAVAERSFPTGGELRSVDNFLHLQVISDKELESGHWHVRTLPRVGSQESNREDRR